MSTSEVEKRLKRAKAMTADILEAIENGDSKLAQQLTEQRLSQLQEIDYGSINEQQRDEYQALISGLIASNNDLIAISNSIKDEVLNELNKLKKSRSGSRIYHNINKI